MAAEDGADDEEEDDKPEYEDATTAFAPTRPVTWPGCAGFGGEEGPCDDAAAPTAGAPRKFNTG